MSTNADIVLNVTEQDFQREVLDRSKELPVVVDFWAPWCGPCRALGPVLERLAGQHQGEFQLVKLNTDENPNISAQFGIRSIPAVMAFKDGKVVDEFIGALPETQVRAWLARLLPTEADRLVGEGIELVGQGYTNAGEDRFRQALALDANHPRAIAGLARILMDREAHDEARGFLRRMPGDPEVARLLAELDLKARGGESDLEALRRAAEAAPQDAGAHLALGTALAAASDHAAALEALLASVRIDKHYEDDAARKAMLQVFQLLGDDHPLTSDYRRKLANLLF